MLVRYVEHPCLEMMHYLYAILKVGFYVPDPGALFQPFVKRHKRLFLFALSAVVAAF
jgi:hypothetical protein